ELEWDFAAAGGNMDKAYYFCGSNKIDEVAVYIKNSNKSTANIGSKKENELSINDMSGNVWEWCWDWYFTNHDLYDQNIKSGSYRIIKGGSWLDFENNCRLLTRNGAYPSSSNSSTGFRIAKSIK
ncbi:MAG: formylglycine-generating enzyme family protein, partial [Candidatus Delongbacteria bacterium]|nr:formylglycine-generating enzyme family protein [Candidatus Delongbacteria bacterium]